MVAVWGGFVVYGTYRRWSLFVDPPWILRPLFGGFQRAKELRGEKSAAADFYLIGIGLIVFGLIGFFLVPSK